MITNGLSLDNLLVLYPIFSCIFWPAHYPSPLLLSLRQLTEPLRESIIIADFLYYTGKQCFWEEPAEEVLRGQFIFCSKRPAVGAVFITPAFWVNPRWEKRHRGRDEYCPYRRVCLFATVYHVLKSGSQSFAKQNTTPGS